MDSKQAADRLGISQNAIYDARKRGTLHVEIDEKGNYEITDEEVERYRREHLGRRGQVSGDKGRERARKGRVTLLKNQDDAAREARQHHKDGTVTQEDAATLGMVLAELAETRRELQEARESRQLDALNVTTEHLTIAPPVLVPDVVKAPEELIKMVRRAEAVALRLEAVASRLEISVNS